MKPHPFPTTGVLGAGLLLGVLGNALLRAEGDPGLNLFVWAAAVAAATLLLHHRTGGVLSGEAAAFLGLGVLFTAGLVWRGAPELKLLGLASALVCFALPAFRAGVAWVKRSSVAEYVTALVLGGVTGMLGAAPVLIRVDWQSLRQPQRDTPWRHAAAGVRGVVIATPLIVVFGGLFIAADAVFAGLVADNLRIDVDRVASHVILTGFLAWIATGYLRGFLSGTKLDALPAVPARAGVLGITEIGTALMLVNLLFLAFVIVQFRYLFGGTALIEVTPGLTYAEYARRGFFELVAVVALTLPWLLAADWLLRRDRPRDEHVFRTFTGIQIALVAAVLLSAMRRMQLYQSAYGLTSQRFYATALLVLLAVVLSWFVVTVLRGRRERFAFGTLVASLMTVGVLYAVNPDAVIARTNIARAQADAGSAPFDAAYATSLSADAVPVLLAGMSHLPADARCRVAGRLLRQWSAAGRPAPLRSWNWSDARARAAVRQNETALHAISGDPAACPPRDAAPPLTDAPAAP